MDDMPPYIPGLLPMYCYTCGGKIAPDENGVLPNHSYAAEFKQSGAVTKMCEGSGKRVDLTRAERIAHIAILGVMIKPNSFSKKKEQ